MNDGGGEAAPATAVVSRVLLICNQRGLHARAAARFVKCVEQFDAEVTVTKKETTVSGVSIMGLMMLAAGPGTTIEVTAKGAQARDALDALTALVDDKFGEEE